MQTTYPHILQSMGITIGRLSTVFAQNQKGEKGKGQSLMFGNEAKRDEILQYDVILAPATDTRPNST